MESGDLAKLSNLAAAHRKTCARVLVAGVDSPYAQREYSSVLKAFECLKLPIKAHRVFRDKLKLAGTATIGPFIFTAIFKETKAAKKKQS